MTPAFALLAFAECGARAVDAEECQAIEPDAGDWETMQGDRRLLWSLVPNTEFKTGNDITRINAIGLREHLMPSERKNLERSESSSQAIPDLWMGTERQ